VGVTVANWEWFGLGFVAGQIGLFVVLAIVGRNDDE